MSKIKKTLYEGDIIEIENVEKSKKTQQNKKQTK